MNKYPWLRLSTHPLGAGGAGGGDPRKVLDTGLSNEVLYRWTDQERKQSGRKMELDQIGKALHNKRNN